MIRGIGASRAGLAWEQSRSEVIANNVANVNSSGFKRSVAVGSEFNRVLLRRFGDSGAVIGEAPELGPLGFGAVLSQVIADQADGEVEQTGNPLDVVLKGPGEFVYDGPGGPGYTRNGQFRRDAMGVLVTDQGFPVLVDGGPVGFAAESVSIEPGGVVLVDGRRVGRLDVRGGQPEDVVVGGLERSNVNLATEMTDLITSIRSFQANQRALQVQDETLGKAVAEIGRLA